VTITAESESLHRRVRAFIDTAPEPRRLNTAPEPRRLDTAPEPRRPDAPDPGGFDELALEIARFQARQVPALARLLAARGVDIDGARDAGAIPAVPCDAFRLARVAAHPAELDERVFRTSGTSDVLRGEHFFRTTRTYEAAAVRWGRAMLFFELGPDTPTIALAPPLAECPDSSLGFMIDRFARALGGPASWHLHEGAIDVESLTRACAEARRRGVPALVLGTSFAFVHLSEAADRGDLTLPAGSRAMQTGGFKGRAREVSPGEMRALILELFGLREPSIVGEYGMTELSSQLYEATLSGGAHGVYHPPPWLRVSAVDPTTLEPVPDGEIGLARMVDLANVDSAVAVQTSDRVRVTAGGVELLGRQPGATPRGCSLAIDRMLERP